MKAIITLGLILFQLTLFSPHAQAENSDQTSFNFCEYKHFGLAMLIKLKKDRCEVPITELQQIREFSLSVSTSTPHLATEIPEGIFKHFSSLIKLDLSKGNIKSLSAKSFEGLGQLKQLDLSHNNISELHPGNFEALTSLKRLNLNGNVITKLRPQVFQGLSNLLILDLSDNKIFKIYPEAFDDIDSLDKLSLSNNQIRQLEPKTFVSFIDLTTLSIKGNLIKKMSRQELGLGNETLIESDITVLP